MLTRSVNIILGESIRRKDFIQLKFAEDEAGHAVGREAFQSAKSECGMRK